MSNTEIEAGLVSAYQSAIFEVYGPNGFCLKIGEFNPELLALYDEGGACAAFITASNPHSQLMSDCENKKRNEGLLADIKDMKLMFREGEGRDSKSTWPSEKSFLVQGLSLEKSLHLGNKYQQNAIVWCDADAVPQLVLLK